MSTRERLYIGAAVLLILALALLQGMSHTPPKTTSHSNVESICNDGVSARLTSPSSAKFSDSSFPVSGGYTVVGTVDSQNTYGAMLRSSFTCELTPAGDSWQLDHVDLIAG